MVGAEVRDHLDNPALAVTFSISPLVAVSILLQG